MPTLERVRSDALSSQIKQLLGLAEDEEVYIKVIRPEEVARIKQKMEEHEGLTHSEMEIAADLNLIDREQFWYWTPEVQTQVRRARQELEAGEHQVFDSIVPPIP